MIGSSLWSGHWPGRLLLDGCGSTSSRPPVKVQPSANKLRKSHFSTEVGFPLLLDGADSTDNDVCMSACFC